MECLHSQSSRHPLTCSGSLCRWGSHTPHAEFLYHRVEEPKIGRTTDAPAKIPPGGLEAQIPTGIPQGRPAGPQREV